MAEKKDKIKQQLEWIKYSAPKTCKELIECVESVIQADDNWNTRQAPQGLNEGR